jgi:hypothetical protein
MPFGRLLLAAVFLCSLPALTQDHPSTTGKTEGKVQTIPSFRTAPETTALESGRINPKSDKDKDPIVITPETDRNGILVSPEGPLAAADSLCYAIRSYVVKRDSKDSDSVHPVGYSTCVPATRYRLKTADAVSDGLRLTR